MNNVDFQWIINGLFTVIGAGIAWFVNIMWKMIQSLQSQVVEMNVEVAKNYVPRAELQRVFDNFDKKLDDIQKMLRERA